MVAPNHINLEVLFIFSHTLRIAIVPIPWALSMGIDMPPPPISYQYNNNDPTLPIASDLKSVLSISDGKGNYEWVYIAGKEMISC